jgi:hypothetical protein
MAPRRNRPDAVDDTSDTFAEPERTPARAPKRRAAPRLHDWDEASGWLRYWWLGPTALIAALAYGGWSLFFRDEGSAVVARVDSIREEFAVPERLTVQVQVPAGDISVFPGERAVVEVAVDRSGFGDDEGEAARHLQQMRIELAQEPNRVVVRGFGVDARAAPGRMQADVRIAVPPGASLHLRTGTGNVDIRGITGPIDVSVDGGRGGNVIIGTPNGDFALRCTAARFSSAFALSPPLPESGSYLGEAAPNAPRGIYCTVPQGTVALLRE